MGDIEDLKQAVHRDVVIPLSEFQAKAQALDTVHDQCVQEFQNAIQALFGPSSTFNGAAADAIAELAGKYLSAERALGDYTSNSLSYRLGSATHLCQTTVAELEPLLAALHDFPAAQAFIAATGAVKEALPPTEESLPPPDNPSSFAIWLAGLVIVLAGAGTLAFMVEYNDQQMKANQIDQAIRQWQGGMRDLAAQPESKLPPEPTDPKPFLASPGSILYPPATNSLTREQREVQDILTYLSANGINGIDQSDVENLVRLGYDRATIIKILLAGISTTQSKADIDAQLALLDSRINQDQRKFQDKEMRIVYLLSSEGKTVLSIPESTRKTADALVNGVPTEFKTLDPGADNSTVKTSINNAMKQARDVIIDARGSGLTEAEALRAIARVRGFAKGKLESVRIIGDGLF